MTNWCTARTAADSSGGAIAQPIRHPVALNVFDTEDTVTVLGAQTGSAATGRCWSPSSTTCSYASSASRYASCRSASSPSTRISSARSSCPVGFVGVFTTISRVRSVTSSASRSRSSRKSGNDVVR